MPFIHSLIQKCKDTADGTWMLLYIPKYRFSEMFQRKGIRSAELRVEDGRHITADQRKKAYATIRDIADYTGYHPEECKELMKYEYVIRTGDDYISLSDCSVDTAREFINIILDFALENGIPLTDFAVDRTDDIGRYLYSCLAHKRCAVCGRAGEIHHVDAIGMGNDRRKVDDSGHRKICLCREHHTIAHQRGMIAFERMYHVYGIIFD